MEYLEKTQVYGLPLSKSARNLLMRRGYTDIIQLLNLDYEGFKKIPGMGDGTIREIVDCLLGLGYELKYKEDLQENIKIKIKPVITLENISINELTNVIVTEMEYNQKLDEINKKKLELLEVYKKVLMEQQELLLKEEQLDKELNDTKLAVRSLRRR